MSYKTRLFLAIFVVLGCCLYDIRTNEATNFEELAKNAQKIYNMRSISNKNNENEATNFKELRENGQQIHHMRSISNKNDQSDATNFEELRETGRKIYNMRSIPLRKSQRFKRIVSGNTYTNDLCRYSSISDKIDTCFSVSRNCRYFQS